MNAEVSAVKEMTVAERAQKALSLEYTEDKLKTLANKSKDLTEIKNDADYELVKRSALDLVSVRTTIQKAGKAARDDATAFSKAVIAEERRLISIISPEEERLKKLRKDIDDKERLIAEQNEREEEKRIERIEKRINGITKLADGLIGAESADIQSRIEVIESMNFSEEVFDEFVDAAKHAAANTIELLKDALQERLEFERQKAEQDRVAQELLQRQREIEAKEAAIREKEKEEEAKRIAEIEKLAKEKEAENLRIAEEQRIEEEKRLEQERLEKEAEEAARREAARPDVEKTADWLKKIRFIDGPGDITNDRCQALIRHTLGQLDLLVKDGLRFLEEM